MTEPKKIELLSPAADREVARAAIDAGADAVYMGGPAFGARSKASNSLQDLASTVSYAHRYAARVFLTLNTLVYDHEIAAALELARQAREIGVDALLIQDLGLLEAGLRDIPIELHASTQCHIDTPEKALFLQNLGFKRLVLARELSLREIAAIKRVLRPEIEVETFIHGALCVSYSGRCYMSCYMNGRSGNRGECAQSCRMAYSLENARGEVLLKDRYLLSMKDLNADAHLEDLVALGVDCLKIEGRLKDADYVKNVTYYYRRRLDEILNAAAKGAVPEERAASHGRVYTDFVPDVCETFHRPYTDFNLSQTRSGWAFEDSPKAVGERVGTIKKVLRFHPDSFSGLVLEAEPWTGAACGAAAAQASFASGDGLCYLDKTGVLQGNYLEKIENKGRNKVLYMKAPDREEALPASGTALYRNRNRQFEKALQGAVFERKIEVEGCYLSERRCFILKDKYGNEVEVGLSPDEVQPAENPRSVRENFARQLSKLGGTAYRLAAFVYRGDDYVFVPASKLNAVRRQLVEKLDAVRQNRYRPQAVAACGAAEKGSIPMEDYGEGRHLDYRYNCANRYARSFYLQHGAREVEPAFELAPEVHRGREGEALMLCKYCIRAQVGQCLKNDVQNPAFKGDLFLRSHNHKFALKFDCEKCRMEVHSCKQ